MTKGSLDVFGIGNAITDLQISISEEEFAQLGLEKGSMNLVDEGQQQKVLATLSKKELNQASGGSAANTVIALAELGASTAYCCLVGDDSIGMQYLNELNELGVKTPVPPKPKAVSGTSLIVVTPDAERTMNTHLGVSAELGVPELDQDILTQSKWLYVEGYLFASSSAAEAAAKAIEIAKANDVKVAITFSDAFIVEVFGEALRAAVASADLVFANIREAQAFTGKSDPQEAFAALAADIPLVALTMSEKGALVGNKKSHSHVTATPVKEVDATGAGDMFAGGFLYGLIQGYPIEDCGKLACYLGSMVVAKMGPRLQGQLEELLASQEGLLKRA